MKLKIKKSTKIRLLVVAISLFQDSSAPDLNNPSKFLRREPPIPVALAEEPGAVSQYILSKRVCGHSIASVLPIIRKFGSHVNAEIIVQTESFDMHNKPILFAQLSFGITGSYSLHDFNYCYKDHKMPHLAYTLHTHPDNLSESFTDMQFIALHTRLLKARRANPIVVFLDYLGFIITRNHIFFPEKILSTLRPNGLLTTIASTNNSGEVSPEIEEMLYGHYNETAAIGVLEDDVVAGLDERRLTEMNQGRESLKSLYEKFNLLKKLQDYVILSEDNSDASQVVVAQAVPKPDIVETPVVLTKPVATASLIPGRYLDNNDGTVTDTQTGLMWQRCSVGQTWNGTTCVGRVSKLKWDEVMFIDKQKYWPAFACYSDWRSPTEEELRDLIWCSNGTPTEEAWEHRCDGISVHNKGKYQEPTIDLTAFPNTPLLGYWTSSSPSNATYPYSNEDYPYFVDFINGYVDGYTRNYNFAVRLVRGLHSKNRVEPTGIAPWVFWNKIWHNVCRYFVISR